MFRFVVVVSVVSFVACLAPMAALAHAGHNSNRGLLVIQQFPTAPEAYAPEAAALVREGVIERFGHEEWSAIVLSHEVHQHIGIYTILGAKMGVYAREILKADTRSVAATLRNEGQKAMTCAADGLQVSLGSTFGQGLIAIAPPTVEGAPLQGVFEQANRRLTLTLKPEFQSRIDAIIEEATQAHGFLSDAYFEAVERESYRVWAEFDRHEIFLDQRTLIAPEEQGIWDADERELR
jgi:pyrimidine-specific ribonucleoside hydrolase